jgi:hypothetical protein
MGVGWRVLLAALPLVAAALAGASVPNYEGARVHSLAYVGSNSDVVFAAGDGLFRSLDGGGSWNPVQHEGRPDQILTDPHDAQRVIAFSSLNGLATGDYLESVDGGNNWLRRSALPPGWPRRERGARGTDMDGFVLHPSRPGHWVALVEDNVFATTDAGATWTPVLAPSPPPARGRLVATRDAFYVATAKVLWHSDDGSRWQPAALRVEEGIGAMVAMPGDRIAVRVDRRWLIGSAREDWQRVMFLSGYERRHLDGPSRWRGREPRLDSCLPRSSPALETYIFDDVQRQQPRDAGHHRLQRATAQLRRRRELGVHRRRRLAEILVSDGGRASSA